MNKRRATTLVELVICMSIGSSLMLLSIEVAHQAFSASSRAHQRAELGRTGSRLAQQFRYDVHRATEATVEDPATVRVRYADETVVIYKAGDGRITREHSPATGETEHESYFLGQNQLVSFKSLDDPKRMELVARDETNLHNVAPRLELHVAAVVGKLRQAEQSGETEQ